MIHGLHVIFSAENPKYPPIIHQTHNDIISYLRRLGYHVKEGKEVYQGNSGRFIVVYANNSKDLSFFRNLVKKLGQESYVIADNNSHELHFLKPDGHFFLSGEDKRFSDRPTDPNNYLLLNLYGRPIFIYYDFKPQKKSLEFSKFVKPHPLNKTELENEITESGDEIEWLVGNYLYLNGKLGIYRSHDISALPVLDNFIVSWRKLLTDANIIQISYNVYKDIGIPIHGIEVYRDKWGGVSVLIDNAASKIAVNDDDFVDFSRDIFLNCMKTLIVDYLMGLLRVNSEVIQLAGHCNFLPSNMAFFYNDFFIAFDEFVKRYEPIFTICGFSWVNKVDIIYEDIVQWFNTIYDKLKNSLRRNLKMYIDLDSVNLLIQSEFKQRGFFLRERVLFNKEQWVNAFKNIYMKVERNYKAIHPIKFLFYDIAHDYKVLEEVSSIPIVIDGLLVDHETKIKYYIQYLSRGVDLVAYVHSPIKTHIEEGQQVKGKIKAEDEEKIINAIQQSVIDSVGEVCVGL